MEAGESVQSHPQLHSEFKASLGYIRSCLKTKQQKSYEFYLRVSIAVINTTTKEQLGKKEFISTFSFSPSGEVRAETEAAVMKEHYTLACLPGLFSQSYTMEDHWPRGITTCSGLDPPTSSLTKKIHCE